MVVLSMAEPALRPRSRGRDPSPVNEPDDGGADLDSPALGRRAFLGSGERRVQFGEVELEHLGRGEHAGILEGLGVVVERLLAGSN